MKNFKKIRTWKRAVSFVLAAMLLISSLDTGLFVHAAGSVISIGSAEDLKKIGTDAQYPMSGDYKLTADIDLSGSSWEPMGGHVGNKGTCDPTQPNVFSGTFDGQGHVISGLTINLSGSIQANKYGQVGLFSVIGSNNANDYAEVKNLIFTDVNIQTDFSNGLATIGTLAGEVNGYANISGIAVLDGTLNLNPSAVCDTVGAGGVIGECRTEGAPGNQNITIKDCYNGADLFAKGTREDLIYASGIVGRVAKSACQSITQCVNTGMIQYEGYNAYAIASAEGGEINNDTLLNTVTDCYVLSSLEQLTTDGVTEVKSKNLTGGTLPDNLSAETWQAVKGCYPVPKFCFTSSAAGRVYLSGLSLEYAAGEDAANVKTEIVLPQTAGEEALTWTSSQTTALSVENGKAVAHPDKIWMDTTVMLTAATSQGYSRSFKLIVKTGNVQEASFQFGTDSTANYSKPGTPITVSVSNLPEGTQLTYQWSVDGRAIANTGSSYTPTKNDLEKLISVAVRSSDGMNWNLSTYCSELPVIYIDTEDGQGVNSNTTAKDAVMKVQGNDEFNNPEFWYSGATTIKGRGNSTWSEAVAWGVKKPYKLKLDKKANILGVGRNNKKASKNTNKHWTLLANMIDHTNMRNEIAYNFSRDIGMEVSMGTTNVVLILNGEYQGIYELAEHVRIGSARVNVQDWEDLAKDIADMIAADICANDAALDPSKVESDLEDAMEQDFSWLTSGTVTYKGATYRISDHYKDADGNPQAVPDFTGGFLLDMDFRSTYDQYRYKFISTFETQYGRIPMFFRSPEYAKTSSVMMNYAKNYLNAYEAALRSPDHTAQYEGKTVHYTDLFDMDSLLQYWLLCEYVINWDSMKNSTYLYKDLEGKAKMGPAWDYDWAWGNINMYNNETPFVFDNWHTTLCGGAFREQAYQGEQWNRYLVKDPYFVTKAFEIYQKYRPTVIEDVMKDGGVIDTLEAKYQTASDKNDEKWSYSYGNCRGYAFVNGVKTRTTSQLYNPAVESLKTFIQKRIGWLDQQFENDVKGLYSSLGNQTSSAIAVTASRDAQSGVITATANVTDANVDGVTFVVNGKKVQSGGKTVIPLTGGKASIAIDGSYQEKEAGLKNTIQVLGVKGASYVDGAMNFTNLVQDTAPIMPALTGKVGVKSSSTEAGKSYPGDTLTVEVSETNNSGTLNYQWYAGDAAISGATKNKYKLTDAEVGKVISVKVTSTDETGELTGTYSGTVAEKEEPNPPVKAELTGKVSVTSDSKEEGKSYPDNTLTAEVKDSNNSGTLNYQWYAGETAISGATNNTYKLTDAEVGKVISVKVTSTEETGELTGIYGGTVAAKPGPNPPAKTELTGKASVTSDSKEEGKSYPGDTLTAEVKDSNNSGTLNYQWYAGETMISGATNNKYKLTDAEVGKIISVKVTSTEETGELTGIYTGTVTAREDPKPPVKAELTGTVSVTSDSKEKGKSYPGDTLTAEVKDSNNSGTLYYQWYAGSARIIGATNRAYKLTDTEIGKKISVKVTSTEETGELTGTYTGTVVKKDASGKDDPVQATSIKLSVKSKSMYAYQTLQLKATVKPKGASKDVTYSSNNKKAATVSKTGKVTAKAPGTATITVKAKDGSGVKATCKITVKKPIIKVSGKTSVKRRKSITLTAKPYGLKGTVKWSLNAKGKKLLKLKKIKGNKVKLTARTKTGTAKLTITCGKKKATKTIRVKK